jgi:hypothetical protein
MAERWFGEQAGGGQPGATLAQLVEAVSRLLDGLGSPPVAPGSGLVDPAASALVLPSAAVPGCSLVVQVAAWSSSIGCWWAVGPDPLNGPASGELFQELPLRPDGIDRAVAWLARELRRPVLERDRAYGMVRRRRWSLLLDDGRELPVRTRWLPDDPVPASGLLVAAVAAAVARWVLQVASPGLFWTPWAGGAVRVLGVAAFALLLGWFRAAGAGRPARVRVPMLAGLGLAALGQAAGFLAGPGRAPTPQDPAWSAAALALRGSLPSLLATAALGCWLAAVLGLPGRSRVPGWLAVAAGVGWTLDIGIGLGWLLAAGRDESEALAWSGAPTVALREAALAAAVLLLLAAAHRRPAAAGAGLTGAALLVAASSFAVQAAVAALADRLPPALLSAVAAAVPTAAWFAGAALLAVAAGVGGPAPAPGPSADGGVTGRGTSAPRTARRAGPAGRGRWPR